MEKQLQLPLKVSIADITLRDGIQAEQHVIPTEAKLFMINGLLDAGFKELEVTAFAPPKYQPQFRDWEEVLMQLPDRQDVVYSCVTTSRKATQRAFAAREKGLRVDRILVGITPGGERLTKTVSGMSYQEAWVWIEDTVKIAHQMGIKVNAFITGVFGPVTEERIDPLEQGLEFVNRLLDIGVDDIEHPDHLGEATPDKVFKYFIRVLEKHPDPRLHIFHVHDARHMGIACYLAALLAGVTRFETTMGGLGGFPASFVDGVPVGGLKWITEVSRHPGLVCTEDFLVMLDGMGIETGLNVDKVLNLSRFIETIVGRNLWAASPGPGRVPKRPVDLKTEKI
jgi:hydroxymethylglutaryl-CoA lyase